MVVHNPLTREHAAREAIYPAFATRLTIKEKPVWKEVRGDLGRGRGDLKGSKREKKKEERNKEKNQKAIFNQLV